MNSWASRLSIASILLCTVSVTANFIGKTKQYSATEKFIDIAKQYSGSGQPFIQLINNTDYMVYCKIVGHDERYFKDFYLRPHNRGRWYIEPFNYR